MRRSLPWYQYDTHDVARRLTTSEHRGLSESVQKERLAKEGLNTFAQGKQVTLFDRVVDQLKSPLVLILVAAGFATFFLGEHLDTIVISIVVVINVIIGVAQEARAGAAFEKLLNSQEKIATVLRDGTLHQIPAEELVVGDIIDVSAGFYVPADARIINQKELTINESALTGEWIDVSKSSSKLNSDLPITGQTNMLWMGTFVTSGTARAIVVETGANTQIGSIAASLSAPDESLIPLQKNMRKLAQVLSIIVLTTIILLFIGGLLRGHELVDMLLVSIAVAVAVIPSGLPAAVTVVLALGMERILSGGGLVRHLLAAETLGNTTIILTDKTGTLTKAEMQVADIVTLRGLSKSNLRRLTARNGAFRDTDKKAVLSMALMTADAYVENTDDATKEWSIRGRPVERALVQAALETGLHQDSILQEYPRLDFLPFDSRRRFVASLHSFGSPRSKTRRVFLAGAPELFLTHSNSVFSEGKSIRLLKEVRRNFEAVQKAESASGMRIIAVGYTDLKINKFSDLGPETAITESVLSKPVLSGLVVLHDPIREDVPEAISTAHQAGTHVIMLTGDNPITALKIAQEAGIAGENDSALTGTDIDRLDDQELALALKRRKVFSRVLPQQKLRIARLLKSRGEVVAMTGDGVNDAPALRSADIGIALGSGTEVAKEASDLILLNNSFSIIVRAIEEGRRIRDNLKKIVTYLLSTSFTELFVVSAAIVAGTALPILPTQILWIKIIEETFMNFSFAFEPAEKDVMQRDPRTRAMREILTPDVQKLIAIVVLSTGVLLVGLYFTLLNIGMPIEKIRTYMFIALSVDSIFFTFSLKNLHAPIWKISLFNNRYLLLAFIGSFVSLIMALEIPALVSLLSLADSNFMDYLYILGLGLANLIIIETAKWFAFPNQANKS